jgi:hypothetical protein
MDFSSLQPVEAAVTLSVIWIGLGGVGLAFTRAPRVITDWVFPAGAAVALALALTGLWAMSAPASTAVLPAGVPADAAGDHAGDPHCYQHQEKLNRQGRQVTLNPDAKRWSNSACSNGLDDRRSTRG